ncbi:MAG: AMP-binding protein, partial [bacterium]|nr:AMP-binding protein [bacterium]
TAWGLLLLRYTNTDDAIFGTSVSGRTARVKGIGDIVGLFLNTIPLRVQAFANERLEDILRRIDKALQMREPFESTSLVKIKEYCEIDRIGDIFDSIVVVENYPLSDRLVEKTGALTLCSYLIEEMTHYDLTIGIIPPVMARGDMEVNFSYQGDIFTKGSIERLSFHLLSILRSIIENPWKKTADLEILSEEERNQLVADFNRTDAPYPKDKTLHQLFEEQEVKNPDRTALIGNIIVGTEHRFIASGSPKHYVHITYKELNAKSYQLAHLLKDKGVGPGSIVGVMLEHSI